MTAGHVSAAALAATATSPAGRPRRRHCADVEYVSFVRGQDINPNYRNQKLRRYRAFMHAWPRMTDWFAAPLVERVAGSPVRRTMDRPTRSRFMPAPTCYSSRCAAT